MERCRTSAPLCSPVAGTRLCTHSEAPGEWNPGHQDINTRPAFAPTLDHAGTRPRISRTASARGNLPKLAFMPRTGTGPKEPAAVRAKGFEVRSGEAPPHSAVWRRGCLDTALDACSVSPCSPATQTVRGTGNVPLGAVALNPLPICAAPTRFRLVPWVRGTSPLPGG